jgi:hypothetical protein
MHVPDFFATRRDRPPLLIDVMRSSELTKPKRVETARLGGYVAEALGWEYVIATELPQTQQRNLRFLAGYRRIPVGLDEFGPAYLEACAEPQTIGALRRLQSPVEEALPTLFHLIWHHRLEVDVTQPLTEKTEVHMGTRSW